MNEKVVGETSIEKVHNRNSIEDELYFLASEDWNEHDQLNGSIRESCDDKHCTKECPVEIDLRHTRNKIETDLNMLDEIKFDFSDLYGSSDKEDDSVVDRTSQNDNNTESCAAGDEKGQNCCSAEVDYSFIKRPTKDSLDRIIEIILLNDEYSVLRMVLKETIVHFQCVSDKNDSLLIKNLREIVQKFLYCTDAARAFIVAFPSWVKIRSNNIIEMKILEESLNHHLLSNNCSKPESFSDSQSNSGVAAESSRASNMLSKSKSPDREIGPLRCKIQCALDQMQKDKNGFQFFQRWFNQSAIYVKAIHKIIDFNTFVLLLKAIEKLERYFMESNVNETDFLKAFVEAMFPVFIEHLSSKDKIIDLMLIVATLYSNPRLLKVLYFMQNSYSLFPEAILMTGKVTMEIARMTDADGDIASTFQSLASMPEVGHGIFGSAGVAIDIISIIEEHTLFGKSLSWDHSAAILQVLENLAKEVNVVTKLHETMRRVIFQRS